MRRVIALSGALLVAPEQGNPRSNVHRPAPLAELLLQARLMGALGRSSNEALGISRQSGNRREQDSPPGFLSREQPDAVTGDFFRRRRQSRRQSLLRGG